MITTYFGSTPFVSDGMGKVFTPDTTKYVEIPKLYKTDPRYFLKYSIRDNDRPDELAHRIYGDSSLYWLILSMNDMWPYQEHWPMDQEQLAEYMVAKYPYNNESDVLFYLDLNGNVVNPFGIALSLGSTPENVIASQTLTPVTIAQYEYSKNNAKREIKILDPDFVTDVRAILKKVSA